MLLRETRADLGGGPTPKYYGHRRLGWRILFSWGAKKAQIIRRIAGSQLSLHRSGSKKGLAYGGLFA